MALLKRTFCENDLLSFFPAPYPDESYYSVLCRYMVHSGLPSTRETLLALFGREISPRSTLLLPYMSTALSIRINPEAAITEKTIIRSHTAVYYLGITHKHEETKATITRLREGARCGCRMNYGSSMASPYLRYCPLCAYEEKVAYGEMYWHRLHQLKGIVYCEKHGTRLEESEVCLLNIKKTFIPASFALREIFDKTLDDVVKQNRTGPEELLKKNTDICRDIRWLMENGNRINGLEDTMKRYEAVLSRTTVARYNNGMIEDLQELRSKARDYHGEDFLNMLNIQMHEYFEWESAPTIIAKFLTPLQHVLVMELLCGSVEEFYKQSA